jgi:hypothetical protein
MKIVVTSSGAGGSTALAQVLAAQAHPNFGRCPTFVFKVDGSFSPRNGFTLWAASKNRLPAALTVGARCISPVQPVGPAADGRPAPTSASAQADARRTAPKEADFNRAASGAQLRVSTNHEPSLKGGE